MSLPLLSSPHTLSFIISALAFHVSLLPLPFTVPSASPWIVPLISLASRKRRDTKSESLDRRQAVARRPFLWRILVVLVRGKGRILGGGSDGGDEEVGRGRVDDSLGRFHSCS